MHNPPSSLHTVVVIGYNTVPCLTEESAQGLNLLVEVLFGVLARTVLVRMETIGRTATGNWTTRTMIRIARNTLPWYRTAFIVVNTMCISMVEKSMVS